MNNLAVAQCFGRAAQDYDTNAYVQRRSGQRLLDRAQPAKRWLDLGTGTGFLAEGLLEGHRVEQGLVAVDLSEAMLDVARCRLGNRAEYLRADMHQLPLANASQDALGANLVMQWSPDLPAAFEETARVLRPDGQLLVTLPLADSYPELAPLVASGQVQRHRLPSLAEVEQALSQGPWQGFRLTPFEEVIHFDTPRDLLAHFKSTGAQHVNGRCPGLKGRRWWQAIRDHLESQRTDAGIPLTWRLVLCEAQR